MAAPQDLTLAHVNRLVLRTLEPPGRRYWCAVGALAAGVSVGLATWMYQVWVGLGVTGYRQPVMWAIYITNFVFWVGIAHSGTLISAILFLFRTRWRTPVYRAAETMTVFAVMTAGLFPLIHLGRSWFFYWLLPYPNERGLQPDFRRGDAGKLRHRQGHDHDDADNHRQNGDHHGHNWPANEKVGHGVRLLSATRPGTFWV